MKYEIEGKMSTFGGPDDIRMDPEEGLALFAGEEQMHKNGLGDWLLSTEQAKATGLGRRLNPKKHYVAFRWPKDEESRDWLRTHEVIVEANGQSIAARTVDWGPNTSTKRVMDLSPGLAKELGLVTDNVAKLTVGPDGATPNATPPAFAVSAPPSPSAPATAKLKTPNGRIEIEQMFGNPANADGTLNEHWEDQNIKRVVPPPGWQLYYQDDDHGVVPVSGIRMHRKLEEVFQAVLSDIWEYARQQIGGGAGSDAIRKWLHDRKLDQHGGGFNFRKIHGTSHLSLHSYGIAIDWDPDHNPQGHSTHTLPDWWYAIWGKHGWTDGRHFSNPDPMHVQFATGA